MSTQRPTTTLRDELRKYNDNLEVCLRSRYHMSLRVFKLVKNLTQLVGASAGVYAMSLGADPLQALTLIAFMISGPEALEYMLEQSGAKSGGK
jgi:hypothetical protein